MKKKKKLLLISLEVVLLVFLGVFLTIALKYRNKDDDTIVPSNMEIILPDNNSWNYYWTSSTGDRYCGTAVTLKYYRANPDNLNQTETIGTYTVNTSSMCTGDFSSKPLNGTATVGSATHEYSFTLWCRDWTAISGSRPGPGGIDGCLRKTDCRSDGYCYSVETRCCGSGGGGSSGTTNYVVTTHHYIVGTTTSVYGDETQTKNAGESYTTSNRATGDLISPYTNVYEWNGSTPSNATGTANADTVVTYYYQQRTATITIHHYLENTTTQVHADDTETVNLGSSYDKRLAYYGTGSLNSPYTNNYEWNGTTPSSASGVISGNVELTFYYKKRATTLTIHHYVVGTTTQVHADDTSTVYYTDTYDKRTSYYGTGSLNSPYTNNYEWDGNTPDNANGTVVGNIEIVFYYQKKAATLTIHHYVTGTTTQVHADDVSTVYYSDTYDKRNAYYATGSLNSPYTNNYEWNGTVPSGANGTVSGNITLTFYYQKRSATLTIHHYIVGSTTRVHADDVSTVYYTDTYDKRTSYYGTASLISPYTNVYEWNKVTPSNANGTVNGNVIINFYYRKTQLIVHHYKEGTTTKVHADDISTVFYGNSYSTSYYDKAQLISPYTNKYQWNGTTPSNASGTVNDTNANSGSDDQKKIEVIYYYIQRPAEIIVHHYEWDGINNTGTTTSVCTDEITRNIPFGNNYETNACHAPVEFELYQTPSNYKGTVNQDQIVVTYYYIRKSNLIVHHYEWDGVNNTATTRSLCNTIEEKKYYGNTYQTSPCPSVPTGYKLVETPSNATGTVRDAEIVVNYYYNREGSLKVYHYLWDGFNNIETTSIVCQTEEGTYSFGQNYSTSRCNPGAGYRFYKVEDDPDKGDDPAGIISKFDTVVKYYYIHTGSLTVHHYRWDLDNNRGTTTSVAPDQVTNNLDYGYTYLTSSRNLSGDNLSLYQTAGDPVNGRINKANTEVIYYYAPYSSLTVHHYLDNSTTRLCNDITSTINYNEVYSSNVCEDILNNYRFKTVISTDNNSSINNQVVTGTMKNNVVITYYYELKPATVTVHHYKWNPENDIATTNKICNDVTINGTYTGTYNTNKCDNLNDNSYKFMKVESNDPNTTIVGSTTSGTLTSDNIVVNYYYDYKPATVTVHHYIEGTTTRVHTDEVKNTTYNATYETSYLTTDKLSDTYKNWYIYINSHTGDDISGTVNKDNMVINYFYNRMESTLTVHHYIKGTTTKLAEDEVIPLHYHDTYTTSRKSPNELSNPNYQFESVSGDDPNGIVNKDSIEVIYYYNAIPSKLTIHHYKEGTTDPICEDVVENNVLYNDQYETHACENLPDTHHEFKSVISNDPDSVVDGTTVTGRYNQNEVVIIYYYGLKNARVVTHHYEVGTTTKVHDDDNQNKKHLDPYTTSHYESSVLNDAHKDWYYYINETAGDQPNGVIEKDLVEVIYYYDKKPSTLTVHHYIEGTTTRLAPDESFDYKYHDSYETHEKPSSELTDTDYVFKTTSGDPASGIINKDNVEVIYYYKLKPSTVTVHYYIEGSENRLCEDIVSSKQYKDSYTSHECDNLNDNDYTFKEVITTDPNSNIDGSDVIGTVKQDETVITYYYELKSSKVIVHHYIEGTTERLCDDILTDKKYKDTYTTNACINLRDNDYKYKNVITNDPNSTNNGSIVTGTIHQDEVVVTYYYELKPASVTVHHYIEGTTTKLCNDVDAMYKMKDSYVINLCTNLNDNAYKFKNVISTDISSIITGSKVEGTVTNNFEVTYYYDLKSSQIKVHYLELDTHKKVSDDIIHSGKVYDEITISEQEVEGYRLVQKPDNETITFTIDDQEFTYFYVKLQYEISVDVLEGEGTIEGNEILEHGDDSTPDKIVITPHPEWEISKIMVDGEEIEITDKDKMILDNFKNVTSPHKIEVIFTEKPIPVPITGSKTKLIIASIVLSIVFVFTIIKFKFFKKAY